MSPVARNAHVLAYVSACVEREVATTQRRPALVAADELARLGELAFAGPDGDLMQCAVNALVGRAVQGRDKSNDERAADLEGVRLDLKLDAAALDAGLPIELLRSLRNYAETSARVIVKREAAAAETRAPDVSSDEVRKMITREVAAQREMLRAEMPAPVTIAAGRPGAPVDVRAVIKSEVAAFCRTMHRGVWTVDEYYEPGQMVTFGGSTWICQRACHGLEGKPGESDRFLLIVKRGADGRKR